MRIPKLDSQQFRVYRWENDLTAWAGAHATKAEIVRAVETCCKFYHVPPPKVVFTKSRCTKRNGQRVTSQYEPDTHRIIIRPRHMDICTAAHEAAHAITDWLFGIWTGVKPHGREWMGIYLVLLEKLKIVPRKAAEAYAKDMGLEFCPASMIAPARVRRRYRARIRNACRERRMLKLWAD